MAYDENLAQRVRNELARQSSLEEKKMMGGLTFMVQGKMCVGIIKDELMCRVNPAIHESCLAKPGVRNMVFTKRPMSGFIQVDQSVLTTSKDLRTWINLALEYNSEAKASPSRTKRSKKSENPKHSSEVKNAKGTTKKA